MDYMDYESAIVSKSILLYPSSWVDNWRLVEPTFQRQMLVLHQKCGRTCCPDCSYGKDRKAKVQRRCKTGLRMLLRHQRI